MEILVAREKDAFSSILIERGFNVINLPMIKTVPLEDLSELKKISENLDRFDGIFITSVNAAKIFLRAFGNQSFSGKFYVFGKRSANLFDHANLKTFVCGEAKTVSQFLELIPKGELEGKKFLFVRGERSLRVVPETLENAAEVSELIVYQTVAAEVSEAKKIEIKEKLARGKIGAICFFSPSGAKEFIRSFESFEQGNVKIAAIGETTARFIEANNLRVNLISKEPTAKRFASELVNYLK